MATAKEQIVCPNCGADIKYAAGDPPRRCVGRKRVEKGTKGSQMKVFSFMELGEVVRTEECWSIPCGMKFAAAENTAIIGGKGKGITVTPKTVRVTAKVSAKETNIIKP